MVERFNGKKQHVFTVNLSSFNSKMILDREKVNKFVSLDPKKTIFGFLLYIINIIKGLMALLGYLKSTLLSKVVMAVTGAIWVLYLIGHALGNLQIYIGKESFNQYSYFLHNTGELLWVVRLVFIVSLLLHIITSIRLKLQNYDAKGKYVVRRYIKASLSSRTMLWTGVMILAFVVYHLMHLTFGITNPGEFDQKEYFTKNAGYFAPDPSGIVKADNQTFTERQDLRVLFSRNDVYRTTVLGFKHPLIALAYIIAVIIVGFHINHAIQSMFQTLGMNHPRYFPKIQVCSTVLSILIVLAFISIPITVQLGLLGGNVV